MMKYCYSLIFCLFFLNSHGSAEVMPEDTLIISLGTGWSKIDAERSFRMQVREWDKNSGYDWYALRGY